MKENMYVFRIAKGHEGGEPSMHCPINMHEHRDEILNELNTIVPTPIPYKINNYIDFLHRELWNCGKLRQGWGFDGLDLRLFEEDSYQWIKNYILGAKKYWDEEIREKYCEVATGRYNILKHLLDAKRDSIIFIPKHSFDKHHNEDFFTVCKVVGSYYFDLDKKYNDFGHVIIVKDLKSYRYSKNTLLQGDFIGYRKALGKIKDKHELYREFRFKNFMEKYYNIKIN